MAVRLTLIGDMFDLRTPAEMFPDDGDPAGAPDFDSRIADMVAINEEGAAVSTESRRPATGIPFTSEARERLHHEPLSPIPRACTELAWKYRHELLGRCGSSSPEPADSSATPLPRC
jgi:hypothetical protein